MMSENWIDFDLKQWKDEYRISYAKLKRYLRISHQTVANWCNRKQVPEWAYRKLKKAEPKLKKIERKRFKDFLPSEG